jgi:hypothetical protein
MTYPVLRYGPQVRDPLKLCLLRIPSRRFRPHRFRQALSSIQCSVKCGNRPSDAVGAPAPLEDTYTDRPIPVPPCGTNPHLFAFTHGSRHYCDLKLGDRPTSLCFQRDLLATEIAVTWKRMSSSQPTITGYRVWGTGYRVELECYPTRPREGLEFSGPNQEHALAACSVFIRSGLFNIRSNLPVGWSTTTQPRQYPSDVVDARKSS